MLTVVTGARLCARDAAADRVSLSAGDFATGLIRSPPHAANRNATDHSTRPVASGS